MRLQRRLRWATLGVVAVTLTAAALVVWANHASEDPLGLWPSHDPERNRLVIDLAAAGLVLGVSLLAWLSWRASARHLDTGMRELRLGAAALASGDLNHEVRLSGSDEFADLAQVFGDISRNLALTRRQVTMANKELEARNAELDEQRRISQSLLRNILPDDVADELSAHGQVEPKQFDDVTILFTDFVGFTRSTEDIAAKDLVRLLHDYFTDFDRIARRYGLEKLKTIGDSWMCAGGLPQRGESHPVDTVLAALEMLAVVHRRAADPGNPGWAVRIGIHTGPVIAGVVGIDKFAFDVWGRTVNFSSRVESTGASNRINLSEATYRRVEGFFRCEPRGPVRTKEDREFEMWFVEGIAPRLLDDRSEWPPPLFAQQYEVYFGHAPRGFPDANEIP